MQLEYASAAGIMAIETAPSANRETRSFFMIERGKKFKLAVIALCCLLRNRIYFKERGHWWHRLGMNLKHLKLKH